MNKYSEFRKKINYSRNNCAYLKNAVLLVFIWIHPHSRVN